MKPSLRQEMSTLFDMELKLFLLLLGSAFQEVTKNVVLLINLKAKIKVWYSENCSWKLYKNSISQVGYK